MIISTNNNCKNLQINTLQKTNTQKTSRQFISSSLINQDACLHRTYTGVTLFIYHEGFRHMGQSIQDGTKQNLWKTAFKKFKGIWFA